jgi:hypothetical protein
MKSSASKPGLKMVAVALNKQNLTAISKLVE